MVRAVIFDADGPLYHRTRAVTDRKRILLKKFGYQGPMETFEVLFERNKFAAYIKAVTLPDMYKTMLRDLGVQLTDIRAQRFSDEFSTIHSEITPTPHAIETLSTVKNHGYHTCILTDSLYDSATKWPWLKKAGLAPYVDYMVSSHDTGYLKDSAKAYEICLKQLGTSPNETIFVGHQGYEMAGAHAAGILSVAILPLCEHGAEEAADYHIHDLAELPTFLETLA